MDKYKNKLWSDLNTDLERSEFIECGRANETGIIAKALEPDLAEAYRKCSMANTETGYRQLTIPDVRLLLANFVNWYNNDKDTNCELVNEDIELFISAYKA